MFVELSNNTMYNFKLNNGKTVCGVEVVQR